MTTQKLIGEYRIKISVLETDLNFALEAMRNFKNGKSSVRYFDYDEAKLKAQIAMTRKQDYIQFIKDLEDL